MHKEKEIHLIEITEALFARNGYSETSIRDIAKAAGVNSAMISYYFGSKEKLMEAIIDFRTTDLTKLLGEFNLDHKAPLDKILTFVDFFIEKFFGQRYFYRLIYQLQSLGSAPLILERFNGFRVRNYEMLKKLFDEGARDGTLHDDVDVSLLTSTIVGMLNHVMFNQDNYRKFNHLEDMPENEFTELLKQRSKAFLEKILRVVVK